MTVLILLLISAVAAEAGASAAAATPAGCEPYNSSVQLIPPPPAGTTHAAWLANLRSLRQSCRKALALNDTLFDGVPALRWTQSAYVVTQMHPFDRYFYNATSHRYTVARWVDDVVQRYGGVDGALVWNTYPQLGYDDRNAFDMIELLPGGREGIKGFVSELHARGIKVLWPYNPWDTGTRAKGVTDEVALANLVVETNAEGFNGDTMVGIPESFYEASVVAGRPAAMQAEGGASLASLAWTTLGWGEAGGWITDDILAPRAPVVATYRWLQPKRMTNICRRNDHDRNDALQAAFFNGIGYTSWENLWGCWNGMTERDAEATKRVARLLRYFGARGFFQGEWWAPHTPTQQPGVLYASRFTTATNENAMECDGGAETLWSIVERVGQNLTCAPVLAVNASTFAGCRWYDVTRGVAVVPTSDDVGEDGILRLSLDVEAHGFAALLATGNRTDVTRGDGSDDDTPLDRLLAEMRAASVRALASYDNVWRPLQQTRVTPPPPAASVPASANAPRVRVMGASRYRFVCQGARVTANFYDTCPDVQYAWEKVPTPQHNATVSVSPFDMDVAPVSCGRYAAFLNATGYEPADSRGFLRGWPNWRAGVFPHGNATTPVTSVSYAEAKAFCSWAGGRLPTSVEWQYAAQGGDSQRRFPWGSGTEDDPTCRPVMSNARETPAPEDSGAFASARCASPLDLVDISGNVWQYTADEFYDDHTRFVILRGGSRYDIRNASLWYAPATEALALDRYTKYYLMDDAYERAYTVGFRCAYESRREEK